MATVTQLTSASVKQIGERIEQALKEIGEEFGVEIKNKGARYNDELATFKIEVATLDSDGAPNTIERAAFTLMCGSYGLKADDLDKVIRVNGDQYRITGLAHRSRRFPILAERVRDGRGIKLQPETVVGALAKVRK